MTEAADTSAPGPEEIDSENEIVLADRYRILPNSPLPEMGMPGSKAYTARDLKNPNEQVFARICEPNVFPRVEVMVQLKNMREAYTVIPEDWGPIYWPATGERCFAIIFRRPEGGALMPSLTAGIPKIDPEILIKTVLSPALVTLSVFERKRITHRAIRPDNIFKTAVEGAGCLFGDCVSVPPSWGQSTIFETIESSMAPPWARGRGTISDDIYALGASLLILGIGKCTVSSMNERDLLNAKVDQGSFGALLNGDVVPGRLREPIRGMLSDDPMDRWTLEDLTQWAAGTLRRTARPIREYKTDRPVKFRDKDYRNTRTLAQAYGVYWKQAASQMKTKAFDTWLQRGLSDTELVEDLTDLIAASAGGEDDASASKLVTRVCALLDPEGPLRYKGLSAMPDGLGYALSHAFEQDDKDTVGLVTEMIHKGLASDWFELKIAKGRSDLTLESKTFKRLQQFVRQSGPGYGVERVLYELNPFLPCRSPMLKSSYVYSLRDLLPAIDRYVAQNGGMKKYVDRHIAAFVGSRIKGSIDSQLAALEHSAGVSVSAKIGMTGMLAKVQYEHQNQMTPHLTTWLAAELEPAISKFQSKTLRQKVREKIDQAAQEGNLMEIYHTLSNKNLQQKDNKGHARAKREYTEAQREIGRLESAEFQEEARRTGWKIAAGISLVIGVVTTVGAFSW